MWYTLCWVEVSQRFCSNSECGRCGLAGNAVALCEQSPDNVAMDLSKLPRLSQSKGQTPTDPLPAAQELPEAAPVPPLPAAFESERPTAIGEVGNIWLSLIIGVVVMLMGWGFAQWATATLLGRPFESGYHWEDGRPVAYWDVVVPYHQAISDSALFLFGLACVLEAAAMAAGYARPRMRTVTVSVALLITVLATVYNVVACAVLFKDGITPLLSLLAVGFGGYMAFAEWGMLRERRS